MSIRISEIFGPTIQGEGALIGRPTLFVRTGGCDYRCSWCDTLHAVDSEYRDTWKSMSAEAVFEEIKKLSGEKPLLISLSGGNPAIQPLGALIDMGHAQNYHFAMETQGSIAKDWFSKLDHLVLSPKPPSSDMDTDWNEFDKCIRAAGKNADISLKIVVKDEADYAYARETAAKYCDLPIYLQPCNATPPICEDEPVDFEDINTRTKWLITKTSQDKWFDVKILPQLHVMIWENKRGV